MSGRSDPPPRVVHAPDAVAHGGEYDHHAGPHACRPGPCPYWAWVEDYVDGRSSREYLEDHPGIVSVVGLAELTDPNEVPNRGLYFVDREERDGRALSAITSELLQQGGAPVFVKAAEDIEPVARLVWSEVSDMMSISPGIHSLDDLIAALEQYRDDPPEPDPPRRGA